MRCIKLVAGLAAFVLVAGLLLNMSRIDTSLATLQNKTILVAYLPLDFSGTAIDDFETAYPDIHVQVVDSPPGPSYTPRRQASLDTHLAAAETYVETADVLYTSTYNLSVEATRAGLYLDLAPFEIVDETLNRPGTHDFLWDSFRWNDRLWAIPAGGRILALHYDRQAFDTHGLPYPSASWSMADITNAARTLAEYDDNEDVAIPGLLTLDYQHFLLNSLVERPLYTDTNGLQPDFSASGLNTLIADWQRLTQAGVIAQRPTGFALNDVPMIVGLLEMGHVMNLEAAPLPGGVLPVETYGFAVNADTARPEAAYKLASFLATHPDMATSVPMDIYTAVEQPDLVNPFLPERIHTFVENHRQQLTSSAQFLFSEYLTLALERATESSDASAILLAARQLADESLARAEERNATSSVSAPAPRPTLPPGQITLRFGTLQALTDPDSRQVTDMVRQFVETDETVGAVEFVEGATLTDIQQNNVDCFYRPYSAVNSLPLSSIQAVEPYVQVNEMRLRPAIQDALRRDNTLYGYPILILPTTIWYPDNSVVADVDPATIQNWDWNDFSSLLSVVEQDSPVFIPPLMDMSIIWSLVAAQDAIPYDFSDEELRIDLTSPDHIAAIRNVLDRAKDGSIQYEALAQQARVPTEHSLFNGDTWYAFSFKQLATNRYGAELLPDSYRLTTYPQGMQYIPLLYDIGSGYIHSQTLYADACFRWLEHLRQNAHSFSGIPVGAAPDVTQFTESDPVAEFYTRFLTLLDDPRAYHIPVIQGRFTRDIQLYAEHYWVASAFDDYVLNEASLTTRLQETQTRIDTYRGCRAEIPFHLTGQDLFKEERRCVQQVDPDLAQMISGT